LVVHERDKPADSAELASIADRGRAIAAYDQAAWHATDAVQALHPKDGLVRMYMGRLTSAGWVMDFGHLNEGKDAFLLAYETTPTSDIKQPRVKVYETPVEERGTFLNEARALDTARTAFPPQQRPYNDAVLPDTNDSWFVYFYPAQTTLDSFPAGADIRYRVSQDGKTIEETHKMHASLLENKLTPGSKPTMSFHTAFLDDAPEDTDVADVLMMGGVRMIICGPKFTYEIAADGTPSYVSTTKVFLKALNK
jgi:hypothetical protein